MRARVKVRGVDMGGAAAKVARRKNDPRTGAFAASEAARLMDKYVPFRSGALASSATVAPWSVTYAAPYAGYVFEGRNMTFSKQSHPLARSRWHEPLRDNPAPLAAKITQYLESM
jgi:hypothetical protein